MDDFGIKVGNGRIKSVLYLRDENKHVLVKGLDCHPPVGMEVVIDGVRWRVVEWTDRLAEKRGSTSSRKIERTGRCEAMIPRRERVHENHRGNFQDFRCGICGAYRHRPKLRRFGRLSGRVIIILALWSSVPAKGFSETLVGSIQVGETCITDLTSTIPRVIVTDLNTRQILFDGDPFFHWGCSFQKSGLPDNPDTNLLVEVEVVENGSSPFEPGNYYTWGTLTSGWSSWAYQFDLYEAIHLTKPFDNTVELSIDSKPTYTSPITFEWEAPTLVDRYTVTLMGCGPNSFRDDHYTTNSITFYDLEPTETCSLIIIAHDDPYGGTGYLYSFVPESYYLREGIYAGFPFRITESTETDVQNVFFDDFTYDCVANCGEELLNEIWIYDIGGEATWTVPGEPLRQEVWHSSNNLVQLTFDPDPANDSGVLNFEIPSGSTISAGSEGVTNPWIKTKSDVFNPGTYAARVKFSQGPDSNLTQTFWLGSTWGYCSDPDEYAEIDYEFYPAEDRLDLISWEWAGLTCEGPFDNSHRRFDQKANVPTGVWLDLIIWVLPGYEVGFSIYDRTTGNLAYPEYWVSGASADFTPEEKVGMNIRLQSWLQGTFGSQLTVSQDYPFEVDWVIHLRNSWSQTWSDINALVESFRASGIKRADGVNVILASGFESGDTSVWSDTVP